MAQARSFPQSQEELGRIMLNCSKRSTKEENSECGAGLVLKAVHTDWEGLARRNVDKSCHLYISLGIAATKYV